MSFQTYAPAFPVDLGTGVVNGSQISCVPVSGITITKTGKLTCTLVIGTSLVNTLLIITDYDPIPSNTAVTIYIDQIATLALGATSKYQLLFMSTYAGDPTQYVFYSTLIISPPLNPTATAITTPAGTLTVTRSGSTVIKQTTTFTLAFTISVGLTAN